MIAETITDVHFIHGWTLTPDSPGWYQWAGGRLQARCGVNVHIPAMPNTDTPKPDAWVNRIKTSVNSPDCQSNNPRNHLFICHSLGAQATNLWMTQETDQAEEVGGSFKIGGIIYAAANIDDVGFSEISSFFGHPAFHLVRSCTDNIAVLYGNRDPFVEPRQAELMTELLEQLRPQYPGIPLLPLPQAHLSGAHEDIPACDEFPFIVELARLMIQDPDELKRQFAHIEPFLGSAVRARQPTEPYPYVEFRDGVLAAIDPNIEEHLRLGRAASALITQQKPEDV